MVTITIIIVALIIIWSYKAQVKAEKQVDYVDPTQRKIAICNLPHVKYNFRDKNKFERAIRTFNTWDNNPISVFSYCDGYVFVKYKDGMNFTANLDQLEVLFRFEPSLDMRSAIITLGANQFYITEDRDETMTESEWDNIFAILTNAKIIHQSGILTKEYREREKANYQAMKNTMRMRRIMGY